MRCATILWVWPLLLCVPQVRADSRRVKWPAYGGDEGSKHYSALNQINRGNVKRLQVRWRWAVDDNIASSAESVGGLRLGESP